MTQEEKLLKLLQVAVENGWENYYTDPDTNTIIIRNEMVSVKGCEKFSLNDLVTNFEEGEMSFIEALILSLKPKRYQKTDPDFYRKLWVEKPTSQRLNWLFEIFLTDESKKIPYINITLDSNYYDK